MNAAMLVDDAGIVVEDRVELRLLADCFDHRTHQERQDGKFRAVRPLLLVQCGAQLFERGDVDFLDIGDVRYA